jgi:hypothetical protein
MLTKFNNYLISLPGVQIKDTTSEGISFIYNRLFYIFIYEASDPNYVRLILPGIAAVSEIKNIENVLNEYNSNYKAIKMTTLNENILLSVEQFIYSEERVNEMFARMINVLESAINNFRSEYQQHNNNI